jgi:fluoroacetyl-CoA thioesterase
MRSEVENGLGELEIIVTSEMTAQLDGKEIHPVYSTFWAAKHAETAARRAIEPYFEENENAVGGSLTINHKNMAAVGTRLAVTAKVSGITGNRILCTFEIIDVDSELLVADGSQVQIVLPQSRINDLIKQAYNR